MQKILDKRSINAMLLQHQVEDLDAIARRFKISRNEALRLIVETGLDAYRVYEGLGMVKLAEVLKRIQRAVEKDVQPQLYR